MCIYFGDQKPLFLVMDMQLINSVLKKYFFTYPVCDKRGMFLFLCKNSSAITFCCTGFLEILIVDRAACAFV